MKKTISLFIVVGMLSMAFFSSCSFGLLPVGKGNTGKTTISLQFNTIDALARADSSDRAVIQGDGFLYIRTIGGPKSSSGPLYGPYAIKSGEKFETTEIPAGTYQNIGFLFVATNVDSQKTTYNGQEYTFRELMSLPDAEFNSITGNNEGISPFNEILDGNASGKLYGEVTIKEGTVTPIEMTLEPITGSKSQLSISVNNSIELVSDGKTIVRKFIRLEDSQTTTQGATSATDGIFSIVPDANGVINKIAMYDQPGNPLASFTETTGSSGPRTFKYTRTPNNSCFIYLEFTATSLKINAIANGSVDSALQVQLLGGISVAGKKMFVGLHDSNVTGNLIGGGIMTIGADGSASVQITAVGTTTPVKVTQGTTYYLSTFIDVNNNYGDVTDISDTSLIMPHYGDYTTTDKYVPVTISGSAMKYQFQWSTMVLYDMYIYFIASSATGTGDGQTPANACDMSNAISKANTYTNATSGLCSQLYLTGPVSVNMTMPSISANINITSIGTAQTLSLDASHFFTLVSDASVILYNVIVDGQNLTRYSSLFNIPAGATLTLANGSIIKNSNCQYNGAGVNVSGGSLLLAGGEISYCTSAAAGGGIELNTGSVFISGGSVHDNSALSGGGIHITDGYFSLIGTSTVNNNTATNQGGGIYIANGASGPFMVTSGSNSVTGNHVTATGTCGGGVYIDNVANANAAFTASDYVTGNTSGSPAVADNVYDAM